MPQLSADELTKAESMSMEELRAAAMNSQADEIEVPAEEREEPEVEKEEESEEAVEQVFRKVIKNEDGTADVYEGANWEEVVEKIAEGKRAAVAQMKRVQAERQELAAKVQQQNEDANYVTGEKFKQDPVKAAEEIAERVIARREAAAQRNVAAQSKFVNTHPDYIADPSNGNGDRMMSEYRRLFPDAAEFTSEGLEKAYLNLKRDGLLVLRSEEADAATETEVQETSRTEKPRAEATQPRSSRRSSTISTRGTRVAAPVKQELSEDELYSMPLDKLRALADKQLAEANRE